ncbi:MULTISPECIES: MerR family transcriptional regulator [unclassified Streptomyces]|uniref:MerR family transcriptional regulator n=1 Tax=unclassified Streptomyces TaxID=2593676 RepID=UPI0023666BF4|nr:MULTISPECIES: MerR family transcriptional regulator [unclassified Streptomyces]MDF3142218.1 MerR family transcriptional regulator [Streptomyces sp. T21Q-yed]WDF39560.1 MerR family transcriptional regulator [Streptomyces sp. T12]
MSEVSRVADQRGEVGRLADQRREVGHAVGGPTLPAYRIEDLAHLSGATVRTIRAYQDRGLLPRPERRGRANVYSDAHLVRLRQIADLLDRGYTLASIKELLEAWDAGRGLGGVLGLVAEVDGPWTDEEAVRISRAELDERFGGTPDDAAVADAVDLGVLEPVPGDADSFLVPSPQELAVAVELHAAGVPLSAISGHLRELRGQVEHIAARFLEFTTEHVFARYLDGPHRPSDAEAAEAASLVRRLRPLAQQTVDAELARAMRLLAVRHLRQHLDAGETPDLRDRTRSVTVPAETMAAVERLVGPDQAASFIALAAEREVRARALDRLAANHVTSTDLDETS